MSSVIKGLLSFVDQMPWIQILESEWDIKFDFEDVLNSEQIEEMKLLDGMTGKTVF